MRASSTPVEVGNQTKRQSEIAYPHVEKNVSKKFTCGKLFPPSTGYPFIILPFSTNPSPVDNTVLQRLWMCGKPRIFHCKYWYLLIFYCCFPGG
jgi:hypothetical protein